MGQSFKKLDDGKIQWEFIKEESSFEDQEFGAVGVKSGYDTIIFDSKEIAEQILLRDLNNVQANIDQYEAEMKKNEHSLDKFTDLKSLVEAVGKLHNDFKEVKDIVDKPDSKRDLRLVREFNSAKAYIVDEMKAINGEYQKYLNYKPLKEAFDFNKEQLDKINKQLEELRKL